MATLSRLQYKQIAAPYNDREIDREIKRN